MIQFSQDPQSLLQSDIRSMSQECEKVGGINLAQGICNLEIPKPVREGAKKAIDSGINHYTRYDGLPMLRNEIAKKMQEYNHITADPEKNIIVTPGTTGAFQATILSLLHPSDEVILFEPFYAYHASVLLASNIKPVFVKLRKPDWSFNPDELEKSVTKKTRAIIVNSPANPSGKVFSKKELEIIAALAIGHNLFVITDEIYEYFVYDGKTHISIGTLPHMQERTITLSGYSKTFSITGWRIGYCVCSEALKKKIGSMADLLYICPPAPLQAGVAQGIKELDDTYYDSLKKMFQAKRDKLCKALSAVGMAPSIPQGAYYILADSSTIDGKTSKEKALNLLYETGIATVPGSSFYNTKEGDNFVRFCFAVEDDILSDVCERLENFGG